MMVRKSEKKIKMKKKGKRRQNKMKIEKGNFISKM